jgi:hypothetical protein
LKQRIFVDAPGFLIAFIAGWLAAKAEHPVPHQA